MKSHLTIGGLAALFLASATLAQPAAAFTAGDHAAVRSVRIQVSRADMIDEAGARRVLEQLGRAARRACTIHTAGIRARAGSDFENCRALAQAAAVRELNAPLVTALHNGERATMALASK
jgi:UrcA family protein